MIVVSDTSCISNLLLINQLILLQKIYTEIFIPPAVYKEIIALKKSGTDLTYFETQKWIVLAENFTKAISLAPPKYIDPGEAEAIDLAIYLKADRLLIDERKGTRLAHDLGLATIGLLGVLVVAKQNGFINSVKELLDKLKENNFWISELIYSQILNTVHEQ